MDIILYKMIYKKEKKKKQRKTKDKDKKANKKDIYEDNIRILGKHFVKNNINKGKLIIKNKKYKLKEFFEINDDINENNIKISMILNNELSNASYMFKDCISLIELSLSYGEEFNNNYDEELNENKEAIVSDFYINRKDDYYDSFYKNSKNSDTEFSSLNFSEISQFEATEDDYNEISENNNLIIYKCNYIILTGMFKNCKSLISMPDLSLWNINNSVDLSDLFYNCSSLSSLPDISKWNINNVLDISRMFFGCELISLLPDISKWNTSNICGVNGLFQNCNSLTYLPDISKFKTNNIIDMSFLFSGCISLISLPDIHKWNTNNVIYMSHLFFFVKIYINYPIYL